jgi:hypothetical protein
MMMELDEDSFSLGPSALEVLRAVLDRQVNLVAHTAMLLTSCLREWVFADDDQQVYEMVLDLCNELGVKDLESPIRNFTVVEVAATAVYLSMHKRTRVKDMREMHQPARINLPGGTIAVRAGCSLLQLLLCAASVAHVLPPYSGFTYVLP